MAQKILWKMTHFNISAAVKRHKDKNPNLLLIISEVERFLRIMDDFEKAVGF